TSKGAGKGLAWGFGIGLPLFAGAIFLAFLSEKVFPPYEDSISKSMLEVSKGGVHPLLIFLFVFTLIVMAPICEETFFRGYFYPVLRNRMSAQAAMLLNGFIFSAVHLSLAGFLPRFLLGCGLSYIYDKKRNLLGPIVAHSLYNGLILLLSGIWQLF
ncbi:MAG: CPBP family intramembrane metalloprotease, partial [Actinomycetota bacterium]|nr:CPBP family intramembrane metalloprotease [Actinomycetota bacterium]